ncbi:ABC transporter substrate-binding protein [Halococcus agarilyticus]|uniref:ABC transporter substrate-binding protein n=1 Tax=Halococcus agarilyticus TaxID=1232219 RepID=UPI000678251D|nr:ABC transporter substrate-binding protein [Halococcus agarilyticus]
MSREAGDRGALTRRECVRYGGALVGGGLFAGCIGGSGDDDRGGDRIAAGGSNSSSTSAETSDRTGSKPSQERTSATQGSYEATPKPYGPVSFDEPPNSYATTGGAWTDVGFAFGSEPAAMSRIDPYPTRYYDLLPGVAFDTNGITDLGNPSEYGKEQFYELDVDALLVDRILLASYADWKRKDFEEIGENVAPFCGSYIRNEWSGEALGMDFSFPHYDLPGAVTLAGEIFQQRERATAWTNLHESFRGELRSRAPSKSPSIGLLYSASKPAEGTFMITDPTLAGVATRQYRTFGVENGFVDVDLTDGWKTDYEGLLEADPEYLFFDSTLSMSQENFEKQFVTPLENSEVGSELRAVEQGNVFRGGGRYQGPIINLFVSEVLAKQLYPEQFGEFSAVGKIPQGERLFDRKRVADLINGDFQE